MTLFTCIIPNCTALATWGYGSLLRGTHRSACTEHRYAIWPDEAPTERRPAEERAVPPKPARSSTIQAQGSLFA